MRGIPSASHKTHVPQDRSFTETLISLPPNNPFPRGEHIWVNPRWWLYYRSDAANYNYLDVGSQVLGKWGLTKAFYVTRRLVELPGPERVRICETYTMLPRGQLPHPRDPGTCRVRKTAAARINHRSLYTFHYNQHRLSSRRDSRHPRSSLPRFRHSVFFTPRKR